LGGVGPDYPHSGDWGGGGGEGTGIMRPVCCLFDWKLVVFVLAITK